MLLKREDVRFKNAVINFLYKTHFKQVDCGDEVSHVLFRFVTGSIIIFDENMQWKDTATESNKQQLIECSGCMQLQHMPFTTTSAQPLGL